MSEQRQMSVLVKGTSVQDTTTDRAIEEVRGLVKGIPRGVLDGAQLIEDVALVTTEFRRIAHKLGRVPVGYIARFRGASTATMPTAAFTVFDNSQHQTDADKFLYLRTVGANVTVNLVVF